MSLVDFLFKGIAYLAVAPVLIVWTVEYFWNESTTWTGKLGSLMLGPILFVVTPLAGLKKEADN